MQPRLAIFNRPLYLTKSIYAGLQYRRWCSSKNIIFRICSISYCEINDFYIWGGGYNPTSGLLVVGYDFNHVMARPLPNTIKNDPLVKTVFRSLAYSIWNGMNQTLLWLRKESEQCFVSKSTKSNILFLARFKSGWSYVRAGQVSAWQSVATLPPIRCTLCNLFRLE